MGRKLVRLDGDKIRLWAKLAGYKNITALATYLASCSGEERIGTTAFFNSLGSHTFKSATLNAIANAVGRSPLDLITVDEEVQDG